MVHSIKSTIPIIISLQNGARVPHSHPLFLGWLKINSKRAEGRRLQYNLFTRTTGNVLKEYLDVYINKLKK